MPLLSFGEEDAELWRDDPHEYVRKGYDVIEDIYSSKTAAMGVIAALCGTRKKSQLDPIMAHIISIMTECSVAMGDPSPTGAAAARRLDGALLAVGTLSERLKKVERYKAQLEPMLQQYVIPLFSAPHGHLRAKGCWLAGLYADTFFAEGQGKGATFSAMLQCNIAALTDPELPVRVDAAVAMRSFVDAVDAEDLGPLRPLVPDLLQRFLAISHEVDSEDVTSSLETVVEGFGSDMGPYAVTVVTALTQQFWRAIAEEESTAGGEDDGEFAGGALAGYSVLRAISTVLDAVSSLPELYPQLEELLYPILEKYTSEEGLDVFEEVTQLITYLTYFGPGITPRMWTLYPRLLHCLDSWAVDYWKDVLLPLDNYISRGPDALLVPGTPSTLLDLTNQTLAKALALPGSPEVPSNGGSDAGTEAINEGVQCAGQLISVLLQNLKGKVDHCVGPYLQLIVGQLHGGKDLDREVSDSLLVAASDALYYNPALTLNALASAGSLSFLMGALATSIGQKRKNGNMKHFIGVREKKVVALGLTAVLGVPPAQLPPGVAETAGQVATAVVALLLALKSQQEIAAARTDVGAGAGSDSGSDGLDRLGGGYSGAESDDESEEDEDQDARLGRAAAAARRLAEFEDDDGDSGDDWWSEDDEDEIGSPLDSISPYIYFAETLQAVQNSDAAAFAAITSRMDQGTQAAVQGMMAYAVEMKNAQLAAAGAAGQ